VRAKKGEPVTEQDLAALALSAGLAPQSNAGLVMKPDPKRYKNSG
jgi:hypothetical protein